MTCWHITTSFCDLALKHQMQNLHVAEPLFTILYQKLLQKLPLLLLFAHGADTVHLVPPTSYNKTDQELVRYGSVWGKLEKLISLDESDIKFFKSQMYKAVKGNMPWTGGSHAWNKEGLFVGPSGGLSGSWQEEKSSSMHIVISLVSVYAFCQIRAAQGLIRVNDTHLASSHGLKTWDTSSLQAPPHKSLVLVEWYLWNAIRVNPWPSNLNSFQPETQALCKSGKKWQLELWERRGGCETAEKPPPLIVPLSRQEQPEDTSFTLITLHVLPIASLCTQ